MLNQTDIEFLYRAIALAQAARQHGNHPFGALIVSAEQTVLAEAENTVNTERDCTGHAELNVVRQASQHVDRDQLTNSTLYTSTEPCAMCAGAIHWSGIGRVVYALGEDQLFEMIGAHPDNQTLQLPCRQVFAAGDRPIVVEGPFLVEDAKQVHLGFWDA